MPLQADGVKTVVIFLKPSFRERVFELGVERDFDRIRRIGTRSFYRDAVDGVAEDVGVFFCS